MLIYINIIKAHKTCYAHSPSITPKISSHGLINRYEQFNLNCSTKHIISQKYFMNTIRMNSETLGLLFTANHLTYVPSCEPEIQWPFRPHTHHNMIYFINYEINTQNSPYTVTDYPNGLQKFPLFGPKFWDRSNDHSRPQSTQSSTKHLNKM